MSTQGSARRVRRRVPGSVTHPRARRRFRTPQVIPREKSEREPHLATVATPLPFEWAAWQTFSLPAAGFLESVVRSLGPRFRFPFHPALCASNRLALERTGDRAFSLRYRSVQRSRRFVKEDRVGIKGCQRGGARDRIIQELGTGHFSFSPLLRAFCRSQLSAEQPESSNAEPVRAISLPETRSAGFAEGNRSPGKSVWALKGVRS